MSELDTARRKKNLVLRRDFLAGGAAIATGALSLCAPELLAQEQAAPAASRSYAASAGYLVYDSRLCLGCQSCMFLCSLTHEGEANPALSGIQILRDAPSFTRYPYDTAMSVRRQCVTPLFLQNCPMEACHVESAYGNVGMIDESKCIGCKTCIHSCPQRPHRTVWNFSKNKSTKCDLSANPQYWIQRGGPAGNQACVEIRPAKAIKLLNEVPPQSGIAGYDIDLARPPKAAPPKPTAKQE